MCSAAQAVRGGPFCFGHEKGLMLKGHYPGTAVIATTPAIAID